MNFKNIKYKVKEEAKKLAFGLGIMCCFGGALTAASSYYICLSGIGDADDYISKRPKAKYVLQVERENETLLNDYNKGLISIIEKDSVLSVNSNRLVRFKEMNPEYSEQLKEYDCRVKGNYIPLFAKVAFSGIGMIVAGCGLVSLSGVLKEIEKTRGAMRK